MRPYDYERDAPDLASRLHHPAGTGLTGMAADLAAQQWAHGHPWRRAAVRRVWPALADALNVLWGSRT